VYEEVMSTHTMVTEAVVRAMPLQLVASKLSLQGGVTLAGKVRRRPEREQRAGCSLARLEALDQELARRAGEAGRLRFEIGQGLDLLERSGGDHALGFSSIEAYALERCERSASWAQKARGLARRLEALPQLAEALVFGSIQWSMAAVLATVARPDDADFWLGEASRRTVREMRVLVASRRAAEKAALGGVTHRVATHEDATREDGPHGYATREATTGEATTGEATTGEATTGEAMTGEAMTGEATTGEATTGEATTGEATTGEAACWDVEPEPMRVLTLTVPREDAWCFEQAKLLARHLSDGPCITDAEAMFGLVAEATSTLCGELPRGAIDVTDDAENPQRAWERELARMRAEAEVRCEANFRRGPGPRRAAASSLARAEASGDARAEASGGAPPEGARIRWAETAEGERTQGAETAEGARIRWAETAEGERTQGAETAEAARIRWAETAEGERTQGAETAEGERTQGAETAEAARIRWAETAEGVDRQLWGLARELVTREVAYGRALEGFFASDGWRRLGYATAAQYARERLGVSLSSIKSRRQLAKRLG
jgi:hypothetical protein